MKRLILAACLLLAIAAGLAWSLRRHPSAAPLDDPSTGFTVAASGPGQLITYREAQIPLRAFRWLPPLPGGFLAAQVLGQNDRQRVALFHAGQAQDTLLVLKPVGVADGFWRFAMLKDAAMAPGGLVLLLYQAGDPSSAEPPLLLAVDEASQQVQWFFRGAGDRLALADGPDPAVFLFGGRHPVQRLALVPRNPAGPGHAHPAPRSIDLPAEVPDLDDLLPTGPWSFLTCHRNGLSAYRASSGWVHYPAPADRGVPCQAWRSSLTRAGKEIWWQAAPGALVKVKADGSPLAQWQANLASGDGFARDTALLRLVGADPEGRLWFVLAVPKPSPPPAAAEPAAPADAQADAQADAPGDAPAEAPEAPPESSVAAPAEGWETYIAQGLDRLYRWDPARRTLARVAMGTAWAALNPPPSIQAPALDQDLVPEAGAMVAQGPRSAWWLPLEALELAPVGALKPVQAR